MCLTTFGALCLACACVPVSYKELQRDKTLKAAGCLQEGGGCDKQCGLGTPRMDSLIAVSRRRPG